MGKRTQFGLPIALIASFLAVGLPYWMIPYNELNLPDALMTPGLFAVVFAALLLRAYGGASFWKAASIVGAAVPAAVFARVIWDGAHDPTSHNLWPLEILIALAVGLGCALMGAIAGSLLAKLPDATDRG
jgi:hypothetical protein